MPLMIDEVSASYQGTLSRSFVEFARRQLVNASMFHDPEQRNEDRHPMMLPVLMVPVNESNEPIGTVTEAITRDIASTSIGLFHENPMECERAVLHLKMAGVPVNMSVKIIGADEMGPFYGSAGWYTEKLDAFPVDLNPWQDEA